MEYWYLPNTSEWHTAVIIANHSGAMYIIQTYSECPNTQSCTIQQSSHVELTHTSPMASTTVKAQSLNLVTFCSLRCFHGIWKNISTATHSNDIQTTQLNNSRRRDAKGSKCSRHSNDTQNLNIPETVSSSPKMCSTSLLWLCGLKHWKTVRTTCTGTCEL